MNFLSGYLQGSAIVIGHVFFLPSFGCVAAYPVPDAR